MSGTHYELFKALYAALMADPSLSAVLAGGKVYDHAPRAAPFPFIAFGEIVSQALDGDAAETMEHLLTLLVYSRVAGRREASHIAERARAILEDGALTVDGHRLVSVRHRDTLVSEGRNQRAYRARLRFRVLTEAN